MTHVCVHVCRCTSRCSHPLSSCQLSLASAGALVLSNGDATAAAAISNTGNSDHGFGYTGQDADMEIISAAAWKNQVLRDTLDLSFDVTSWGTGHVYFQYVFGSDEYPEWAPSVTKCK